VGATPYLRYWTIADIPVQRSLRTLAALTAEKHGLRAQLDIRD